MDSLNHLLTQLGDLLLAPFYYRPATGIVVWSAITGVLMTYVFGKTSNQRALRRTTDVIRAQLFGIKLFKDDLMTTFQCQIALLRSTGMRLLYSLPPVLVMFLPLLLVLCQLAMRYENRPLVQGEQAVVSVKVKPEYWQQMRDLKLMEGDRFDIQTESLRDEQAMTIYWRVQAIGSEPEALHWQLGDLSFSKILPLSNTSYELMVANPKRPRASSWDQLFFSAEASLPSDSPIQEIDIQLSPRQTPILGWNLPWWGTFFLVSMLVAYISGKFLGVQY